MKQITKITYPTLALLALGFAVSPQARADCQEGCDTFHSNTFLGDEALVANTTGYRNTAVGSGALQSNTTGAINTAVGDEALFSNQTGGSNTAFGEGALESNIQGDKNTATGWNSLLENDGNNNTAYGTGTLELNKTGNGNTATGVFALFTNSDGDYNTAVGYWALRGKKGGHGNIALGYLAGSALKNGDKNIAIGNFGIAAESNTIRIGSAGVHRTTYVAGISGVTVAGGVGVVIDANGQLGTMTSSARYKEKIEPMGAASDKLLSLQPVKFRYKKELDPHAIPQFGLVAEDVAKVDPDLVAKDNRGKPYTVRYEAVNAMLLNEFLKEHRKVAEQSGEIADLKADVAELKKALKEQAIEAQQVRNELRAIAPAGRLATSD